MPTVNYSAFTASNVGRLLAEITFCQDSGYGSQLQSITTSWKVQISANC